ncbi:glycerol-3-phosphate dehydrogenase/oxidase [Occultella kanbiaonis]|uniref:glycerol-3-phosphate dehydrogenase/oxidase n=1 Tax=Occultella kanbiaonis TaxID=2675754 RepID=UPI001F1A6363|nr:glycerol-3-phosphate dehydrogenase/oxidase [Occultella kanbiaonis]
MATIALTAQTRTDALAAMSDGTPLDILVIGGGVTGAGIALDAATRGLRVGIVEAQDWASGTSSRSSKLVHGGLRYLQMLDFTLVHEALTERDLLLTEIAPHLVRPVPFLYPLEHRFWQRFYVGSGVGLYDALASLTSRRRALPFHKHLSRSELERVFPDLRHDAAIGAIQYWDASVDDARLVVTLVRTAAEYGALAASRTQVVELTKTSGRVDGAVLVDAETGERLTVKADQVINATGVWTEETEGLAAEEGGLHVLASKGVHIVVPRERIRGEKGLILQTEKSVLFVIPWSRYWVIGTTDTPWKQELRHPVATNADIEYVLEHANAVLANPLTKDDIIGTWAGLRPLLQPGTKEGTSSAKVSREHTVASVAPGLTAIAGGKLTTYRVMAKDAVDFALGDRAESLPSITDHIPLAGAVGLQAVRRKSRAYAEKYGWTKAMVDHLLHRYGSQLTQIVDAVEAQPDLARPLEHAPAYLRAEIAFAATHELVLHLEDVLAHRTRLEYEVPDAGEAALEEILDVIAPILGWDQARRETERRSYLDRRAATEAAALTATDEEGEQARLQADDIAPMISLVEPS